MTTLLTMDVMTLLTEHRAQRTAYSVQLLFVERRTAGLFDFQRRTSGRKSAQVRR